MDRGTAASGQRASPLHALRAVVKVACQFQRTLQATLSAAECAEAKGARAPTGPDSLHSLRAQRATAPVGQASGPRLQTDDQRKPNTRRNAPVAMIASAR